MQNAVMEVTVKLGERGCLSEPRNKIPNVLKTGILDTLTFQARQLIFECY